MKSLYQLLRDECGYSIYDLAGVRVEKGVGQGRRAMYKRIVELDAYQVAYKKIIAKGYILDSRDMRRLIMATRNMSRYYSRKRANVEIIAESVANLYHAGLLRKGDIYEN